MADLRTLSGEAESEDPYAALRAIVRMRGELDRAEVIAVRRARNAGYSWHTIALALGVSKQAVHKKHGRG